MKILSLLVSVSLGMGLQGNACAASITYACPQSIPEASVRLIPPGQGWKPFVASPLYLSGAAPADGPPERLGVLRENGATRTAAGWTHQYSLAGPFPEGKWLRCDYGSLGEVSLAKRLPDGILDCTVTGKKGEHAGENQLTIQCP